MDVNRADIRLEQSPLPTTMPFDALVLNAPLRQSLVTIRSLGRRGMRVAAAGALPDSPAFGSRWCRQAFVFPAEEAPDLYLAALEEWLERHGTRVLIASHDGTVELLRSHRARLEQRTRLCLASEAALTIAVNKERTLAVAQELGLHIPREVVVRGMSDLPAALAEIGLPAVVKPCQSWLWHGTSGTRVQCHLVVTAEEAARAVEALSPCGEEVLFQQYLTGRRETVSFLYSQGRVYGRFAQWALRTRPPLGGEDIVRQGIAVPADTGRQAEALVRAIDLEGFSAVEFRRDAGGVPFLMEINPRLTASVELAVRAGVDFPYLLYRWASGEPLAPVPGYRVGGWMRHLGGDIETSIMALHERGRPGIPPPARVIGGFALSFFRPMRYDYFAWQDPRPALRATTQHTRDLLRRLRSRMRKVLA